ncbi:MAG: efflux RND transporter permease subunit [Gammaproteobacteria bacterium]|nr:efflux RND transporter permease subunit [Gammaproteobacteria bacterium]
MNWTSFFIKRPIFSIALSLMIVLAGIFSLYQLPLRLFPKIDIPVITISVEYPGASAATMKDFVTSIISNKLTGIPGLNYVTASSSESKTQIKINMQMGTDADTALMNVMQKVSSVRGQLPQNIDEPIVTKTDSDDNPTLLLAFTSNSMSRPQMADYLLRVVKPQLETIDGVSDALVMGTQYAMRIWLEPDKMTAYNITPQDVIKALQAQNVQSSPGSLNSSATNFNVTTNADLTSAKQFNNVIIKNVNGNIIHLNDIGHAKLGSDRETISVKYNGKPASMIFVTSRTGANPLTVVGSIKKLLPSIAQNLPSDMHLHEVINIASYIKASIKEVLFTLLEGIFIVSFVIFMFIGKLRTIFIPIVTIPIALIGICFLLMALNFSINMLVLLAMVIAIGLVVDDAIVVMENIFRHIESGLSAFDATLKGTKEIAFPVIAMSLTLAAIFAPIAFAGGLTGKLFSEFALSLAGMVIISGVVALTLSPMMCAHILSSHITEKKLATTIEKTFNYLKKIYSTTLDFVFKHRKIILGIWLLSIIACVYFYQSTPKELAPKEDEGFMQVLGTAPDATNFSFLKKYADQLNGIYKNFNEIESYIYVSGVPQSHQVLSFIRLKPWDKRKLSSAQLQPKLQAALNRIAGLQSVAIVPTALPGTRGMPIQFVIKSIGNYKDLYKYAQLIMQNARKTGLFAFLNDDLKYDQPILHVNINRDAATALNVDIDSITTALSSLLSAGKTQYFNLAGQTYEVIPQATAKFRFDPMLLNNIHIKTNNGNLIPLSAIVSLTKSIQPASLNQFQKFNAITISGVMTPGHTLSQGLKSLTALANNILPTAISHDFAGNSRQFIQEGSRMLWIFLAAFLIIFIVLAMQFESFKDPLIILLGSVPMALAVAMIPLKLGFASINIYTQIGLLTLVGLISKHGILMTKFANNLRIEEGYDKITAIKEAAAIRLRPILMTTLAIVFSAIPLIAATGAGNVSRFDMGIVIGTGMFLGTILTLFVLPVLYYYFSGAKTKSSH